MIRLIRTQDQDIIDMKGRIIISLLWCCMLISLGKDKPKLNNSILVHSSSVKLSYLHYLLPKKIKLYHVLLNLPFSFCVCWTLWCSCIEVIVGSWYCYAFYFSSNPTNPIIKCTLIIVWNFFTCHLWIGRSPSQKYIYNIIIPTN